MNVRFISADEGKGIMEVTVFTDQAFLKRSAEVTALAGLNKFLMEVRAFSVDIDSAQANIYGLGEIISVQYQEIPIKEAPQKDIQELVLKKKALQQSSKKLFNKKNAHDKQTTFLDSLVAFAEVQMPREIKSSFPKTEDMESIFNFLGHNYQDIGEKNRDLSRLIEEIDEEFSVVDRKLKQLQKPHHAKQKVIEVLFESQKEQQINLEVSYLVEKASWTPVYKVDVPLDLSSAKLTMFARINQKSGENWEDVKLTISNAIPLKGTALPEPKVWYLDFPNYDQPVYAKAAVMQTDMIAGTAKKPPAAEFKVARQRELPLAFEYELPLSVSIASGSGETMLPLYTKDLQGRFFIFIAPKFNPLAYLVCQAAPDRALPAGKLNIYFGGRFVGSTTLPEKKAGEDFLINVGAERGIKVSRETITDKINETFFGIVDRSSVARMLEYRLCIENLKDQPVHVRLIDCIPVSKTDRIQVKGLEIDPPPAEKNYQDQKGVLLWDFNLQPKAVQEIHIEFYVKHPKDNPPHGL